jgi:hypothetical protein
VIGADEPIHQGLLLVLHLANLRQWQSQVLIEPRDGMLESQRFVFDAVHQDDADAREGVIVKFADRFRRKLAPGKSLAVQRCPAILKNFHGHV